MADISQITLPSGTTYDLKDATARSLIDTLSSYSNYLGVTTTKLEDGATTSPVTISGASVTPVVGNIVNYGSAEFIYNGTTWQEFGDLSALGELAYQDAATTSYTPAGTVSQPTFTGTTTTITPSGVVSVSALDLTGLTIDTQVDATIHIQATPEGTVSAPTITVAPTTTSMYSMTGVGTLPSCTLPTLACTVADENLTLNWTTGSFSAGTLPTRGSATAVVTNVSATASAPTFTGELLAYEAEWISNNSDTSGVTAVLQGTIPTPTATFSGAPSSYTPAGTVSQPTFTGTTTTIRVS